MQTQFLATQDLMGLGDQLQQQQKETIDERKKRLVQLSALGEKAGSGAMGSGYGGVVRDLMGGPGV